MGPLPDDLGIANGAGGAANHAEPPVADLVAVAVGAVQDVACPPGREARNVGELVPQPGRDQEATGPDAVTSGEEDPEAVAAVGDDVGDGAVEKVAAVPGDFVASCRDQLGGWHAVAREEAVHVGRRGVPWGAVINDDDVSPGPGQDQGGREAGGTAADNDYVVGVHKASVVPRRDRSNHCCRCRERAVQ